MKNKYPVFFTKVEDCVLVEVPDLEILTQGKDIRDAIKMARDAIELLLVDMEERNEEIPTPSKINDLKIENGTFYKDGKTSILLVDVDTDEYRKKLARET